MRQSAWLLALAGALAACSEEDPRRSPPPPGCDQIAYDGTCFARVDLTAAECTLGTFRPEGCPQASWVGTCIEPSGQMVYYYSPNHDAYESHVDCGYVGGTWMGTGAPAVTAWCDLTVSPYAPDVCLDMTGPSDEVGVIQQACAAVYGAWHRTGACPTHGRTGTCSGVDGGITHWDRYYNPATAASDAAYCVADGCTWTPG